jgi:O-antigen/teichoic acid export membrane protein
LKLLQSLLKLSVLGATARVAGFLAIMIVARHLSKDEYGSYAYLLSLIAIGGNVFNFRTYQVLVREYNKKHNSNEIKSSYLRSTILLEVTSGMISGLLIALFYIYSENVSGKDGFFIAGVLCVAVFSQYISNAVMNCFHALKNMGWYGFMDATPQVFFLLMLSVAILISDNVDVSLPVIISIKYASFIAAAIVIYPILHKKICDLSRSKNDILSKTNQLAKMSTFPLITGWLALVYYQADRVMLKWLRDDISEVGVYHNAILLGILITFFTSTISKIIYPNLASDYDQGGMDGIRVYIEKYDDLVISVILPACIVLSLLSNNITTAVFGDKYLESGEVFSIWILFVLFSVSLGPAIHLLYLLKLQRLIALAAIYSVIANVILNFLLIPEYGPLGAVYATGAGVLVNVFYSNYIISKKINDRFSVFKRRKSVIFICAAVLLLGMYVFDNKIAAFLSLLLIVFGLVRIWSERNISHV